MNMAFRHSSSTFAGDNALSEPCREPLSDPPDNASHLNFSDDDLLSVRRRVAEQARRAGLEPDRVDDLVINGQRSAKSLRYGRNHGYFRMWEESGSLICEIRDKGIIGDPLVERIRPPAHKPGGRGLWLANQLCDLVQIRATDTGTVVRLHMAIANDSAQKTPCGTS